MKRYIQYIKPYKLYFILGPLLMLTEVGGEIVLPKLMAGMIDQGVLGELGSAFIVRRALLMLMCIAIQVTGGVLGHYFSVNAAVNFSSDIRKAVFDKIQTFSFGNIDRFSTGSLVTRLTNDVTQVMNITRMALIMAVRAPGMLVGGIIMACLINPRLASIMLVMLPLLAVIIYLIMRTAFPRFDNMQRRLDDLNAATQENITNVRVIKSFVRRAFQEQKFERASQELRDASFGALRVVVCVMPVMTMIMNIAVIWVLWRGGHIIAAGNMQVGSLSAIVQYTTQILSSLMMVSMMIIGSTRAVTSLRRISEVLATEPDLKDSDAAHPEKLVTDGKVEFKNVSFKYYPERKENVLDRISFVAEAGQTLGIIGVTGSGKSSLVQLIPRLYDATEGEVLVDGVNVKDYSISNLREGVGMVLQKNVLFSGSIRDNLRWGDEDATDEEIRAAADMAQADGFVSSFTDGYDMELGQGGVNVSGGQKQRLCIARALLKRPKILILDDSTSAVDTATETKIRNMLVTALCDSTKIIIAQRISSVIEADKIIVLHDGRVVGEGTHEQLLKTNGEYRDIYYSQNDREEKEVS